MKANRSLPPNTPFAQSTFAQFRSASRLPLFLLLCALATGCADLMNRPDTSSSRAITFDPAEIGRPPSDFVTALTGGGGPVSWVVREDSNAPEGATILVQESSDATNYRFPLCIYQKFTARDVAAEVHFRAIAGKLDQAGGIVLRYTPENYYIARANALENNVILFKTVNGQRSKILEVPVPVSPLQWHLLRFEAKGPRLTIAFDGQTVIQTNDTTFTQPGKIGLWTKADSISAFSGLKMERIK